MGFFNEWSEISIGGVGFAQVGDSLYYDKMKIEKEVVLEHMLTNFPVPDEFDFIAKFKWSRHSHDFGEYYDLEIKYNEREIDLMEDDDPEKHDRFWQWVNTCEEQAGWMEDNLQEECQKRYEKEFPNLNILPDKRLDVKTPMNVVHKREINHDDSDLFNQILNS